MGKGDRRPGEGRPRASKTFEQKETKVAKKTELPGFFVTFIAFCHRFQAQ